MTGHDNETVFITRNYQRNIIDVCNKRNAIIFLPTGAGKTYIAIQVIKNRSNEICKPYTEGGKRSVFLVNTVFLAKQQCDAIKSHLPFKVRSLTGEDNVDNFEESNWIEILDQNQVLVMTAQCFHDAVNRSFIKLQQVNVIVFDECHHGRKDHVYHQIMQGISAKLSEEEFKKIRIIGLSGMLIGVDNSIKPHTVHEEMVRLESTFRSVICTVNNLDDHKNVLIHSTKAKKLYTKYTLSAVTQKLGIVMSDLKKFQELIEVVRLDNLITLNPKTLRETVPKRIKDLVCMYKDFQYQAVEMGNFGAFIALSSIQVQLELSKRTADSQAYRTLLRSCITETDKSIRKLKIDLRWVKEDAQKILSNSSDKVQKLIGLLRHFFNAQNREKDLQCIVFVQRRSTAKILYHIIKAFAACMTDFDVRPDFVVGYNNEMTESFEEILNKSQNTLALEKFNRAETNCIVCTNVLEEGIDIRSCNLVIMYDLPTTPRSYIQSSGRARDQNSNYIMMLDVGAEAKFAKKEINWKAVDEKMRAELIGKTLDRTMPSDDQIQNEHEQSWEPYITSSGSELNALNSIQILNQFCMSLPFDRYTKYRETYRRINHQDGRCQVGITMPLSSMIQKEILSDPKENVRLAKQHAAFKACIILIENGNLTDKLTPIDLRQKIEEFNGEYFEHWEKYSADKKETAGTKSNLRSHKMNAPAVLLDCGPKIEKTNFLYRINFKPEFATNSDNGLQAFHKFVGNQNTYGILTTKRIPRLCKFPVFQSFGKIVCEINPLPVTISLENENELTQLRRFHINIFRDILKVFETFFVLDQSSYLIVPLDEQNDINWTLVKDFQEIKPPRKLTFDEIKGMNFKVDDYRNKVINSVYRSDQNYVVIDVLEHKTPLSPFPDQTKAATYVDYFKLNNNNIYRHDQFLIEVKGISKNLNVFFPGGGASGQKKKSQKAIREEYVPELCHNYKFPADYWLKATLLPALCHRMYYLLIAESLRSWLIKEKISNEDFPQQYELDLDYGDYEKRKELCYFELEEREDLPNFHEILERQKEADKQSVDKNRKHPIAIMKHEKLPVDLNRNVLTVTNADIDYYAHFIGVNAMKNPLHRPIENRRNLCPSTSAIKDSSNRTDIKLITLSASNGVVQQKDLMKVLTTAKAGDVFDMERFETLGDAFLKFIASLYLYKEHENFHEGHLTQLKGKMVSNRNLFYVGNDFGLSNSIKSSQFCSGDSLAGFPPSITLPKSIMRHVEKDKKVLNRLLDLQLSQQEIESGDTSSATLQNFIRGGTANSFFDSDDTVNKNMLVYAHENYIGDKIIADAVEALIGCVVSSVGPMSALKLCQKLKILPDKVGLQNLLSERIPPRIPFLDVGPNNIPNCGELQRILGYKFKNDVYLRQALTHSSYPIKDAGTYENLEFLGDAVLDFLITSYIVEQNPEMDPGRLTDLRSALVNNVTLACVIVRKKINKFLLYESRILSEGIKMFVNFQELQNHKVTDLAILMNTDEDTSSAEAIDVPKVLGDIFESIVGGIFLDSGLSLKKTWSVIYNLLQTEIRDFMANVPLQVVRRLYEFNKGNAQPKFYNSRVINEETGDVAVPLKFKCEGREKVIIGIGKNRKIAKNAAAKRALTELEKN